MNRKKILLTVVLCLAFVAVLLAGFMYRLSQPRILSDAEMREYGAMIHKTPRRFSEFQLVNHRGEPFTPEDLEGQWTLIFFGFTNCPDICPATLATLDKVVTPLGEGEREDLQVVMLSVDPARDTPEKLSDYVTYFNEDFVGVTGDRYEILNLATQLSVVYNKVPLDNGDYTMDHSGNIVIINPRGDYHGFFRPPFEEGNLRVALRSMMHTFEH